MADIDLDALLTPVSDAAPSGSNLEYDPAFLALEDAARGKAEQQFGDTLIAAQEPDWRAMNEQATLLFGRTHDLRVAVHWLRAGTRLRGFEGFARGIALVHGLLDRYWDTVHPQLDATDNDDPTMRLSALAPLAGSDAVVVDLRAAPLGSARGSITARQVELAFGKADPSAAETAPSEAGALQGVVAAAQDTPGLIDALIAAHEHVCAIDGILGAKIGAAQAPDLKALRTLTQCLAQLARAARGDSAATSDASAGAAPGVPASASPGVPGTIASRDDALKALDRVCEWIERHEPTNPAPLLIRRAKRLMTKNFLDIIRDLAPEGLSQVERIAGIDGGGNE